MLSAYKNDDDTYKKIELYVFDFDYKKNSRTLKILNFLIFKE